MNVGAIVVDAYAPMCCLCSEPMIDERSSSSLQPMHRACALRSTMGGIGHLIAHHYWCEQRHNPDAGLTYRQSALLVDEYVAVVGVDTALIPRDQ